MGSVLKNNKKGFTLVELLVVIAIIGILAAVVAPRVFAAVDKGKLATMVQDIESIKTAAFTIYAETGVFPRGAVNGRTTYQNWNNDSRALFVTGNTYSFGGNTNNYNAATWNGPYLDKWPENTPFGGVYAYRYLAPGDSAWSWSQSTANISNLNNQPLPNTPFEILYIRFDHPTDDFQTRDKVLAYLREHYESDRIYVFRTEANLGILLRKH